MPGENRGYPRLMLPPFKFLSTSEFEVLSLDEKRGYLDGATAELERTKSGRDDGGWHCLFRHDQQPQQSKPAI